MSSQKHPRTEDFLCISCFTHPDTESLLLFEYALYSPGLQFQFYIFVILSDSTLSVSAVSKSLFLLLQIFLPLILIAATLGPLCNLRVN